MANELSIEWDPLSNHPDVFADYQEIRNRCPVVHSPAFGGYWMLNRYDDVLAAAIDPVTFASAPSIFVENDTTYSFKSIPITLNRPEHTMYRRLLDTYFRVPRIIAFESTVRRLAIDQLTPFLRSGGGDFVREVAYPFPARVLCALLGLDDDMWSIVKAVTPSSTRVGLTSQQADNFRSFIQEVVAERQANPRDASEDLLSGVIAATIDGSQITDEIVIRIVHQLFTAGHTTSAHALGNAIGFLAADNDLQQRLREDPKLLPGAVEEFLRLRAPLHQIARRVTSDVVVDGVAIGTGEQVVLNFASANHDASQFALPETLDVTRSPNRHVTFGAGIHKCLGAPVARMEIRVMLEELLSRSSKIEFGEAPRYVEYFPGGHFISGYEELSIRIA